MSEKEIFKTMTNGTTKNNSSHTYGSITTRPRPVIPNRRRVWVRLIGSAGHYHGARGVPRQIHLLIPRDVLRMARAVRLRHADHLSGWEFHQVKPQIPEVRDVLNGAANDIVRTLWWGRGH